MTGDEAQTRDCELTERPGKGWTRWQKGQGDSDIEKIWWAARVLHFPKLNVSCWFDGSQVVGIEHWGYRRSKWCMKLKPKDWEPLPEVYRLEREREKEEAMLRYRLAAEERALVALARSGRRQSARDASEV